MSELTLKLKKSMLQLWINRVLKKLAQTQNEEEYYQKFDQILKGLLRFAGPNRQAVENVRKAFKEKHPMAELSRLLLQKRLSRTTRERLARNFFCDWVMEAKKRDRLEEEGYKIPWFFVISPTNACNLHCYGCYAYEYPKGQGLSYQALDRILREAKEIGIRWLTISGGEPFYWVDPKEKKDLLDFFELHNDMFFQVYTNGVLLDEKKIERLARLGNVAPAISLEGFERETDERRGKGTWKKIQEVRENLTRAGVLHGFSITVTRTNAEVVTRDEFIDTLIEQNCSFGWYFIYIPIGREPAVELMPTVEQRERLRKKVWEWRSTRPIFIGDFWDDGPWVGGCIAGGRKYFHITSQGDVEPCVFIHFAVDNIYRLWEEGKRLKDALYSPFFMTLRHKQMKENDNWLTPCAIIDKPQILREVVKKFGAYPTHKGAETILKGEIAKFLDEYSRKLEAYTRPEFEKMKQGEYDTPIVALSKVIENHRKKNLKHVETEEEVILRENK